MSKKTILILTAAAELCIGAYFMFACLAWILRTYLFSQGQKLSLAMPIILAVLSMGAFLAYPYTKLKVRELEKKEKEAVAAPHV